MTDLALLNDFDFVVDWIDPVRLLSTILGALNDNISYEVGLEVPSGRLESSGGLDALMSWDGTAIGTRINGLPRHGCFIVVIVRRYNVRSKGKMCVSRSVWTRSESSEQLSKASLVKEWCISNLLGSEDP